MKIEFEFKEGSSQEVVTDCPHKQKSSCDDDEIDWFVKVGSISCVCCKYNKETDFEAQTVECTKNL